jgi:hypothetical protein
MTKKKSANTIILRTCLAVLGCALAACSQDAGHAPPPPPEAAPEKYASVVMNGKDVRIKLKLFRPYDSGFQTYVPEDMTIAASEGDNGTAYRFYSSHDAYLLIFVFAPKTRREDAEKEVNYYVLRRLVPDFEQRDYTARPSFSFRRDTMQFFGGIELGIHGDRFHYIAREYRPIDQGSFEQRARLILQDLKWRD